MKTITLYELNHLIRGVIACTLPETYWIQAELSEVRQASNGHCYVEFVEKDAQGGTLVAKARGIIWNNVFTLLRPYFEKITGQPLAPGLNVLVEVSVTFHEMHGFSLTVSDIDPTYTIGDTARRRKEILQRLESEGVLTLNKELPLPALPQRIAIISSESAAGYGDFCHQIENNASGFHFAMQLFPATMQGDMVERSIIQALNNIANEQEEWDVVVIIRGGGAVSDLGGFDTYTLATNCAQFPLPIITGVGHERDDTLIDCVAHTKCKTPTAVAAFLIEHMQGSENQLNELSTRLRENTLENIKTQKEKIRDYTHRLNVSLTSMREKEEMRLDFMMQKLTNAFHIRFTKEKNRIQLAERSSEAANPIQILKQGYSITRKNGIAVRSIDEVKKGDKITTQLAKGDLISIIK
ncbi:MAG: exodeoxyribonuclease VII large subunit [Bacteroidaceae bacterium]